MNSGRSSRLAVATGLLCCLGLAAVGGGSNAPVAPENRDAAAAYLSAVDRERLGDVASRGGGRQPAVAAAAAAVSGEAQRKAAALKAAAQKAAAQKAAAQKAAAQKAAAVAAQRKAAAQRAAAKRAAMLRPVAGLSQVQMNNAYAIVQAGRAMGMPHRGLVIAVATAMQESTLLNRASDVLPESYNYPHQGTGADHDSVGLFQQRPSSGWGSVPNLMRPSYAARQFYLALRNVPGWQNMSLTFAAQAVQVSAYPYAYAQHEGRANAVVAALT